MIGSLCIRFRGVVWWGGGWSGMVVWGGRGVVGVGSVGLDVVVDW